MRPTRHRLAYLVCLIFVAIVSVSCAPAAEPADPTVAVVEPTAAPDPTEAIEPTAPPPTETPSPPDPTATAEPATPTSEPEPTESLEVDFSEGIAAYQSNGCIGCHTLTIADAAGTVGPTHDGVGTTAEARLADPGYTGTATTPEEYIRESILSPTTYTVPGFTEGVMPSFATMDEAQLDAIVAMLLAN